MEEDIKKLNFNAPLLSVRRYTTSSSALSEVVNRNRIADIPLVRNDSIISSDRITEPASVPVGWGETRPGLTKNTKPNTQLQGEENSLNDSCPKARPIERNEPVSDYFENENDYALESMSINSFSVSDSSDLEGGSRSFLMDPQIRDFMMNRFLPASKAMALKPSQYYASRKQTKRVVNDGQHEFSGFAKEVEESKAKNQLIMPKEVMPDQRSKFGPDLMKLIKDETMSSRPLISSKVGDNQSVKADGDNDVGNNVGDIAFKSTDLRPPLPKKPSSSWLWNALSLIPSKDSCSHKGGKLRNSSDKFKWETMVKTSNLNHDHKRFSKELTTHVSDQRLGS